MEFSEREGVVIDYYKDLFEVKNIMSYFSNVMRDLLGVEISSKEYPLIGRLLKLYGRKSLFYAVVDIAESPDTDVSKFPYGLLAYICKRNSGVFEKDSPTNQDSLVEFIDKVSKGVENQKKRNEKEAHSVR